MVAAPTDDGIDFSIGSANELYNWEVFFHIPLLVAKRLMAAQRFEEARRWLHYLFDPTNASGTTDPANADGDVDQHGYWELKPFRDLGRPETIRELLSLLGSSDGAAADDHRRREVLKRQIGEWLANPFDPHAVARLRLPAYQKAVIMAYLDNLIEWGDHLFRQDTIESINEATQLYILAGQIMGRRPHVLPASEVAPLTFEEIQAGNADSRNRLNDVKQLVSAQGEVVEPELELEPVTISPFFCLPQNPKLVGYWDTIADRLHKIRHCQNIEGVQRTLDLFEPPVDPGALVAAGARGGGAVDASSVGTPPPPPYRYKTLMAAARAAANELVVRLGQPFQQALERRDSEALAELVSYQERDLTTTTRPLRALERRLAYLDLEALERSRAVIEQRRDHYRDLPRRNAAEIAWYVMKGLGFVTDKVAIPMELAAAGFSAVPKVEFGVQGAFSSPVATTGISGEAIANVFGHISAALQLGTAMVDRGADIAATEAGYIRRDEEWELEVEQAEAELVRIDVEIEAARRRVAVADYWTDTLESEITYAAQRDDFLRRRFTNAELHEWMVGRLARTYTRGYDEVLQLARMAERAFQHELGVADTYIDGGHWDGLRQGLTAANALLLDLQRLDRAYLAGNDRDLEVTKRVRLAPDQLARLRMDGRLELALTEADFDRDHPGHYRRRIRSVALTFDTRDGRRIDASLTLRKSSIRTSADLDDDPEVDRRAETIATSGDREDRGLHHFAWDDERLFPFEGRGPAGSEWVIDVYPEVGDERGAITGVELRIDYTARAGGQQFRSAAAEAATRR